MPKEVAPPHDFMTPPAANLEDMTQPMGPLEEGDQALVDAAHMLPEGERRAQHDDGTYTRVTKTEGVGRDQVIAEVSDTEGNIEQAATLINSAPGVGDISADTTRWPADGSRIDSEQASGNEVGGLHSKQFDRERAQSIKLDTAKKIGEATRRLAEQRVDDPEVAREMADAEKPHRDEIAERNQEAAEAGEAAEEAARQYYEDRSLAGDLARKTERAGEAEGAARRGNEISLSHADAAAAEARERHEAEQ